MLGPKEEAPEDGGVFLVPPPALRRRGCREKPKEMFQECTAHSRQGPAEQVHTELEGGTFSPVLPDPGRALTLRALWRCGQGCTGLAFMTWGACELA